MAKLGKGLSYYSTDTDRYQDIKIKKLKHNFGTNGIAVYDYILCEVYRVKGCFLEWDESTVFDVADYFGLKESTVNEIVNYCGSVGLFDKELLSRGRVTSLSIQLRYIDACKRSKRVGYEIPEDLVITTECYTSPQEERRNPQEQSQQSKVKESKIKESKEEESNRVPVLNIDFLKTEFENSSDWNFGICRDFKISNEKLEKFRADFLSEIEKTEEYYEYKDFKAAKRHFYFWLNKRVNNGKTSSTAASKGW